MRTCLCVSERDGCATLFQLEIPATSVRPPVARRLELGPEQRGRVMLPESGSLARLSGKPASPKPLCRALHKAAAKPRAEQPSHARVAHAVVPPKASPSLPCFSSPQLPLDSIRLALILFSCCLPGPSTRFEMNEVYEEWICRGDPQDPGRLWWTGL